MKNNLLYMSNTRILNVANTLSVNLIVVVIIVGASMGGGLNF